MAGNQLQQSGGSELDALASILKLFQGTQTNTTQTTSGGASSGFTETHSGSSGTQLDEQTLANMLKSALESNQGLASVTQGQRNAGLYNSSTNRLMSNDLLARLTARTAEAGAQKTSTQTISRTGSPQTVTTKQATPGLTGGGGDDLAKLMLAVKGYNELGGLKGIKKGYNTVADMLAPAASSSMGAAEAGGGISSNYQSFANLANDAPAATALGVDPTSGAQGLQMPAGGGIDFSGMSFGSSDSGGFGDLFFSDGSAASAEPEFTGAGSLNYAGNADLAEDTAGNFPSAPSSSSSVATSNEGGASASEVLAKSGSTAGTTLNVSQAGGSVFALGTGIHQLTDDNPNNDIAGAANAASGAKGAYGAYQTYDQAASIAATANATNAAEGVSSAYTAADYMDFNMGSAGSGSVLGYVGPIVDAFNAPKNTLGEQGTDYRKAVGGAVLNYFGFGWATPIVDAVAKPILDAAGTAGEKSLGTAGIVASDPVGALISGRVDFGDVITSGLDPANIFGGNEGGSVGGVVGATLDPIGAALGDKGAFSVISDTVNTVDSAISPGRVVCTELALAGDISMNKYRRVIQPEITLRGRILLGYHILGIPAVRRLRRDAKFRDRAIPYVNAYLDHKLGNWNWRGFLIKSIGEPLCYILSFFNKDPEAYKTLYPYRRDRSK